MNRQIVHIEDETQASQDAVYAAITAAGAMGVQLTPMDFGLTAQGDPTVEELPATEWLSRL